MAATLLALLTLAFCSQLVSGQTDASVTNPPTTASPASEVVTRPPPLDGPSAVTTAAAEPPADPATDPAQESPISTTDVEASPETTQTSATFSFPPASSSESASQLTTNTSSLASPVNSSQEASTALSQDVTTNASNSISPQNEVNSTEASALSKSDESEQEATTSIPETATDEGSTTPNITVNSNTTDVTVSDIEVEGEVMAGMLDLQTQLYILSATFGGVIFLLILLVLVLALSVARIKEQLHEALRGDKAYRQNSSSRESQAYENGAFNGHGNGHANGVNERSVDGDDLAKLGYTVYNGRGDTRENVYKVADPVPRGGEDIPLNDIRGPGAGRGKPLMKYEEGVVPLGERDTESSSNYNYR